MLNVKTVLFQTIQFSISTQFTSIWPIDWTLSGATAGNDGNKGVLHIAQSSNITGASPSDCLVLYPGHLLGEFYPSTEMKLVYSASPADWATLEWGVEINRPSWEKPNPLIGWFMVGKIESWVLPLFKIKLWNTIISQDTNTEQNGRKLKYTCKNI